MSEASGDPAPAEEQKQPAAESAAPSAVPDPNCPKCHGTGEKKPGKPCKACTKTKKSGVCSKCNGTGVKAGTEKPCKCQKAKKTE